MRPRDILLEIAPPGQARYDVADIGGAPVLWPWLGRNLAITSTAWTSTRNYYIGPALAVPEALLHIGHDAADTFLDGLLICLDRQFGRERRLVRG